MNYSQNLHSKLKYNKAIEKLVLTMLKSVSLGGFLMNNLIESISYFISDLADDSILLRAWKLRISFGFGYIVLMSFGYMLNSHNYRGFLGFTIAYYGTFIISRLVFEAIESIGEPFEEKPFYKFLF
jgi:hypothetical protein